MPAHFNNDLLLTATGELNLVYIAQSAKARAMSASDTGMASANEIKFWEEKLFGMATMMRTRWRRERGIPDPSSTGTTALQRLAVASLVGNCEAIAASGALTEPAEQSLRLLIAETLSAFDMPSKAERVAA